MMSSVQLISLKNNVRYAGKKHTEGVEFSAERRHAKILVALKKAKYKEDKTDQQQKPKAPAKKKAVAKPKAPAKQKTTTKPKAAANPKAPAKATEKASTKATTVEKLDEKPVVDDDSKKPDSDRIHPDGIEVKTLTNADAKADLEGSQRPDQKNDDVQESTDAETEKKQNEGYNRRDMKAKE